MIYKRALIAVSALALALATAMAWSIPSVAYEQGDWIIRAGAANVDPDTSSDKIDVAGLAALYRCRFQLHLFLG